MSDSVPPHGIVDPTNSAPGDPAPTEPADTSDVTDAADGPGLGGFAELGLRPEVLRALTGLGYEEPTPIQRESIEQITAGRDLVGQAATGTGKTAAFALPILERVVPGSNPPRSP